MTSEEEGSWWDQQAEYEESKDTSPQKSLSSESNPATKNEVGTAFTLGRSLPFIIAGFIGISLLMAAVFVAFSLFDEGGSIDSGDDASGSEEAAGEYDNWISTNGTILETSHYIEDAVTWERTDSWEECYWDDWEGREVCDTYYETYYEDGYECTAGIDYEYAVNGTIYNGSESLLFQTYSPCLDWVYNDYPRNGTVEVWYNEGDPGESRLTEPVELMLEGGLLFALCGCCLVFFVIFIAISMRWQQGGSSGYASGMGSTGGGFRPRMSFNMGSSRSGNSRRRRSRRRGSGGSRSSKRTVGRSGRRSK